YAARADLGRPADPVGASLVQIQDGVEDVKGANTTGAMTCLVLLRVELGLQEFRSRHGRYPAVLGNLSPSILARVPNDPFSGRPLVYRRTGEQFLLYSLGPDMQDDGGTPLPDFPARSLQVGPPADRGDLVAGQLSAPPH